MEDLDKENKPKWLIKKIDDLALCYKTFINKEPSDNDLEICMFNNDGSRYTIASFDFDYEEDCYCLNSCCNRLNSKRIDWEIFGLLVWKGYRILSNGIISYED